MADSSHPRPARPLLRKWPLAVGAGGLLLLYIAPYQTASAAVFVAWSLLTVAPIIVPGVFLAAWVFASGADAQIVTVFNGRMPQAILGAAFVGAITPVCGVTVLPLMAGLLAAGVPLAPVMAFWLSSPITDPAMLAATAATLGLPFAVFKTLAAFAIGVLGGVATVLISRRPWVSGALRNGALAQRLSVSRCAEEQEFDPLIWRSEARRAVFAAQAAATSRLILICLVPAFAAEYALNAALTPDALADYLGKDSWWSIPVAVFVGAPAYLDGYAALPLTRALMDNGMSGGAAMAFLISGGVVSIWGAVAIAPVLKAKALALYLALAVIGSIASGYVFQWLI